MRGLGKRPSRLLPGSRHGERRGHRIEFHPATETILRYLSPDIDVERIGLAADWRTRPRVMFRLRGAQRP